MTINEFLECRSEKKVFSRKKVLTQMVAVRFLFYKYDRLADDVLDNNSDYIQRMLWR